MVLEVEVKAISELNPENRDQIKNLANRVRTHPFQTFEWMDACSYESAIEGSRKELWSQDYRYSS
jgi:hypothetical protein